MCNFLTRRGALKRTIQLSLLLITIVCSISLAQPPDRSHGSTAPSEAEVQQGADRFYEAFLAGDIATVENLTADDYLQTDVNGKVQDKKAWLAEYYKPIVVHMKTGEFKWEVFERKVEQVRLYGDVAVLIGRMRLATKTSARPGKLRFTQVWVKRNGEWQRAVLSQCRAA
jgi:ketosteroid isomerase-like protein